MRLQPLEPTRVRYPRGAYGWVDLKVVTGGFLERLAKNDALTYLFLCAVGNCQGISFWSPQRMAKTLGLTSDDIHTALERLERDDLIATKGRVVQVLSLPNPASTPVGTSTSVRMAGPGVPAATSGATGEPEKLPDQPMDEASIRAFEPQARAQLAQVFGQREVNPSVMRAVATSLARKARAATVAPSMPGGDRCE